MQAFLYFRFRRPLDEDAKPGAGRNPRIRKAAQKGRGVQTGARRGMAQTETDEGRKYDRVFKADFLAPLQDMIPS
jgi:hypothetical protein